MINYNNLIYLVTNIFRVFCISLFLDLFFSKENLKYSKWVQIFVFIVILYNKLQYILII